MILFVCAAGRCWRGRQLAAPRSRHPRTSKERSKWFCNQRKSLMPQRQGGGGPAPGEGGGVVSQRPRAPRSRKGPSKGRGGGEGRYSRGSLTPEKLRGPASANSNFQRRGLHQGFGGTLSWRALHRRSSRARSRPTQISSDVRCDLELVCFLCFAGRMPLSLTTKLVFFKYITAVLK